MWIICILRVNYQIVQYCFEVSSDDEDVIKNKLLSIVPKSFGNQWWPIMTWKCETKPELIDNPNVIIV